MCEGEKQETTPKKGDEGMKGDNEERGKRREEEGGGGDVLREGWWMC
jgi:hypothetical protein